MEKTKPQKIHTTEKKKGGWGENRLKHELVFRPSKDQILKFLDNSN